MDRPESDADQTADLEPDHPVIVEIGPEIDLHSFLPRDIPSVVDEYLHAASAAGIARVRLVHGRGKFPRAYCRVLPGNHCSAATN